MENRFREYLEYLIDSKLQEISDVYLESLKRKKTSCLYEEDYWYQDQSYKVKKKVKTFLLDLKSHKPLRQIKKALENLDKNQLSNTPDLYIALLDELHDSYQLLIGIIISFLYEYVDSHDECNYLLLEFDLVIDNLEDKIGLVNKGVLKSRCISN